MLEMELENHTDGEVHDADRLQQCTQCTLECKSEIK
jgi:hypothetical protein